MAGAKQAPKQAQAVPTVTESNKSVAVGDVVIYALRSGDSSVDIPCIVTNAYGNEDIIDGVLFSVDPHHFTGNSGTKPMQGIRKGNEPGTWKWRK